MNKIDGKCECEKDLDIAARELRDSLGGNCETCGGNGYVPYNALSDTDCPTCKGSGINDVDDTDQGDSDCTAADYADAAPVPADEVEYEG